MAYVHAENGSMLAVGPMIFVGAYDHSFEGSLLMSIRKNSIELYSIRQMELRGLLSKELNV